MPWRLCVRSSRGHCITELGFAWSLHAHAVCSVRLRVCKAATEHDPIVNNKWAMLLRKGSAYFRCICLLFAKSWAHVPRPYEQKEESISHFAGEDQYRIIGEQLCKFGPHRIPKDTEVVGWVPPNSRVGCVCLCRYVTESNKLRLCIIHLSEKHSVYVQPPPPHLPASSSPIQTQ